MVKNAPSYMLTFQREGLFVIIIKRRDGAQKETIANIDIQNFHLYLKLHREFVIDKMCKSVHITIEVFVIRVFRIANSGLVIICLNKFASITF